MYQLDTSFLVDYFLGKPVFVEKFKELSHDKIYISVITCVELVSGAHETQIEETNRFLNSFITIPVTDELARKAGITRGQLRRRGYKKSVADILIGQTALENNFILVTGNSKDFPQLEKRKLLMPFP